MKYAGIFIVLFVLQLACKNEQPLEPKDTDAQTSPYEVYEIAVNSEYVWVGSSIGLSRSADGGKTWKTMDQSHGIPKGAITSVAIQDNIVWVSGAFDSAGYIVGAGLSYSDDNGDSWHYVPQPGKIKVQNVVWDIAFQGNTVWIASFGGGLKKTSDFGQTWETVTPDSLDFDPYRYLNHRVFSVIAPGDELWVGTAAGINLSTDNGKTWENFNYRNQMYAISGNFVVALYAQIADGKEVIWAATREAEDDYEFTAISKSEDRGQSWQVYLSDYIAHNFASSDSLLWIAMDRGLFFTHNLGQSWGKYMNIKVNETDKTADYFYAVAYLDDKTSPNYGVWAGGQYGLYHSTNNGQIWESVNIENTTGNFYNVHL